MAVESFRVEGGSVLFKDVTPGRTTTLQLTATHTHTGSVSYEKHKQLRRGDGVGIGWQRWRMKLRRVGTGRVHMIKTRCKHVGDHLNSRENESREAAGGGDIGLTHKKPDDLVLPINS